MRGRRGRLGEGMPQGVRVGLTAVGLVGLLVLAWFVSGLLVGGGTSGRPASTTPEGTSTTTDRVEAVENSTRENGQSNDESYSAYQSKDPFRQLVAPAQEDTTNGGDTTGSDADSDGENGGDRNGQPADGDGGQGRDRASPDDRDGSGQPSDGGTGPASSPERDSEREATSPGGAPEDGDGLFDSGGDLPPPR